VTNAYYQGIVYALTSTTVKAVVLGAAGTYTAPTDVTEAVPITFGASDWVSVFYRVPIAGWGSSVAMSTDADTRVVDFKAVLRTANLTLPSDTSTELVINSTSFDTHAGFNITNGRYTIPVSGKYKISYSVMTVMGGTAPTSYDLWVAVSGGATKYLEWYTDSLANSKYYTPGNSGELDLVAGQYISVFARPAGQNVTALYSSVNDLVYFSAMRVSGPAQIAASEKVFAYYTNSAGTSIGSGAWAVFGFENKVSDSHAAVSGSSTTWVFTAPKSSNYTVSVKCTLASDAGWTAGEASGLNIKKNGTAYAALSFFEIHTSGTYSITHAGTVTIPLVAGDTIAAEILQNSGGSINLYNSGVYNYISILSD
jgi:hypothetical protein